MKYKNYEEKMKKLRKFRNGLFHLRFVFLGIGIITIATTSALMGCTGVVKNAEILKDTYEFGEEFKPGGDAFLSDVCYQYRKKDSNAWTEKQPYLAGEYEYRYYSLDAFGKPKYSEVHEFEIAKRPITIDIKYNDVVYGNLPTIEQPNLLSNHKITSYEVDYESFDSFTTNATVNKDSIKILENGELDVTDSYDITCNTKEITFEKRQLHVTFSGANKSYDGTELSQDEHEITNLAFDDKVVLSDPKKIIEVGKFENFRDIQVLNSMGTDVTKFYRIYVSAGIVEITKREISVVSKTIDTPYCGEGIVDEINTAYLDPNSPNQLIEGHQIKIKTIGEDLWMPCKNKIYEYDCEIIDQNGNNVTHFYKINKNYGTVTITPKPVHVYIAGIEGENGIIKDTKIYDGRPITINDINCNDLVPGDHIVVEGELQTETEANPDEEAYLTSATYKIFHGSVDVTSCYETNQFFNGVRILKRPIKVICNLPMDKEYDGKPMELTTNNFSVMKGDNETCFDVADGQKLVANTDLIAGITTPGHIRCEDFKASIQDDKGNDVTRNYDIQYIYYQNGDKIEEKDGFAEITKRNVSIETPSYTPNAHFFDINDVPVDEPIYLSDKHLVGDDKFKCFPAEGRKVELISGQRKYSNILTVGIVNKAGEDVTRRYYNLDVHYGKIELDTAQVTVTPFTDDKTYDGQKYEELREVRLDFNKDSPRPIYEKSLKATAVVYSNQIRQTVEEEVGYPLNNEIYIKPETIRITNTLNNSDVTDSFIITTNNNGKSKLTVNKATGTLDIDGRMVPLDKTNSYTLNKNEDITFKGVEGDYLDLSSFSFDRKVTNYNQDVSMSEEPWNGQTNVGIKDNKFIIRNSNGEDVTNCYSKMEAQGGIFKGYYANKITITTPSVVKEYDGKTFNLDELKEAKYIQATNLVEGHSIRLKPGSKYDIEKNIEKYITVDNTKLNEFGIGPKNSLEYQIIDENGNDVTDLYTTKEERFGAIQIKKRKIALKSKNKTLRYNPDRLDDMKITVESDDYGDYEVTTDRSKGLFLVDENDLLPNTKLIVNNFGITTSLPNQGPDGKGINAFTEWENRGGTFRIVDKLTGYDVEDYQLNYEIDAKKETGNLIIKKIRAVITSENITRYYNSQDYIPSYNNENRITCLQLIPGHRLKYNPRSFTPEFGQSEYRESNMPLDGNISIVDSEGYDVTYTIYDITIEWGTVTFIQTDK